MSFRKDFVWGAATAAYQVEGAANEDGRGLSVWEMYGRQQGKVFEGHTAEIACDHYHRYKEDVGIMKSIGLKGYRFSFAWPRILPTGTGAINEKGIAFYDRLIDELLSNGIQPWATLFHWDYPYELFLRGGWLNPDSPKWFSDYARVIVDRFSDRVGHWMTINEPQCFIGIGHVDGTHAPGILYGETEVLTAAHHVLMAHGMAVQTIRAHAKITATIGWAPVGVSRFPASDSPDDIEATRRSMFNLKTRTFWNNVWWADAPVLGHYPEDGLKAFGKAVPKFRDSDMAVIHQPLDFYGINTYSGSKVKAGPDGEPIEIPFTPGGPRSTFEWPVTPEVLYWGPRLIHERYHLPIVITENGMAGHDWVALDSKVHDYHRIDFLRRYLLALRRATDDGVDVRGYFQWSIMDNYEWAHGYKHRFGLVHIDYETLKRTPKCSAWWYRDIIASNGKSLDENPKTL